MRIIPEYDAKEQVQVLVELPLQLKSRVIVERGERKETLSEMPVMFSVNEE